MQVAVQGSEMPPADGSLSAPGQGPVRSALIRLRDSYDAAPLPVKALILVACGVLCLPFTAIVVLALLAFAPYAVWAGRREWWATASVGMWGIALVATQAHGDSLAHYALLVLPVLTALVAHAGALGRWFAPCRTVAWVLLLALLPGIAAFRIVGKGHSLIGPALAWLLAAVVLGWRLAKAWQDSRQRGQLQQVRGGGPAVPVAWPDAADAAWTYGRPRRSGSARAGRPAASGGQAGRPAGGDRGRRPGDGCRAERPCRGGGPEHWTGGRRGGLPGGRAAVDHRRRGDGRAGRDDRPSGGEGPGQVLRGIDRGGSAASHGRHRRG